ncbi:MAG: type II toxin-antitoxin system RelE/ParE family toxin [Actinomycetes bacterium]
MLSVPSAPEPYELVVTPPARRAIETDLSDGVAHAVIQLITGSLVRDPHRVGKQLRRELAGLWVARRGSYRVVYRIDELRRAVVVIRIDHRSDVYRSM